MVSSRLHSSFHADAQARVATPTSPPVGRFAPTPSGPLHLGSLYTALASWLVARRRGGQWRLRIDDLDQSRCPPGTEVLICRQLEAHGLRWDGALVRQTDRLPRYREALAHLHEQQRLYPCACTRAVLARIQREGPDGPVYPGQCRRHPPSGAGPFALRLALTTGTVTLHDGIRGVLHRDRQQDIGDFVVQRADGLPGYQLACVVDELDMGITEVVRGDDLLGSTVRQLEVFAALAAAAPRYAHLPVLMAADGRKLSKQNGAPAIAMETASDNLRQALHLLGGEVPESLRGAPVQELLDWAMRAPLTALAGLR